LPYRPAVANSARRYWDKLDADVKERIREKIKALCNDPMSVPSSKPLNTAYNRSARVGDYRILFAVMVKEQVIVISNIGPRGQVYRD
jgi:mRNA interferase RelE/StbE